MGDILSVIFLSADRMSVGPGLVEKSKLSETLTVFLIFFHINKGADKTGGAQAGLGFCCSNVSKANLS